MPVAKGPPEGPPIRGGTPDTWFSAIGLAIPLFCGGNVFLALEPRVAIALFDVLVLVFFLAWSRTGTGFEWPRDRPGKIAIGCVCLLVVWWLGSFGFRATGPRAAVEAQGLFAAGALYLLAVATPVAPSTLAALASSLAIGTLLTTLYGQYQYWIMFPRTLPLMRAAGIPAVTFVNANFYNANCYAPFLAATCLLAAAAYALRRGAADRLVALVAIAASLATLALAESRSTFVFLAAAILIWIGFTLYSPSRAQVKRLLPWLVGAATVAGGGFAMAIDIREFWGVGFVGRIAIWQAAVAMILDHGLWGVGLGRYWDYIPQYQVTSYYTRYPHCFALEVFAELGIVGFAALAGFLAAASVVPLRAIARLADRPEVRRDSWALLAPVVAAALLFSHGLVDIDWHAPANPILLFLLLGIARHLPTWTAR